MSGEVKGERTVATAIEQKTQTTSPPAAFPEAQGGNAVLIETLRRWGIHFYAGVNGGGVVHVAKHLEPMYELPPPTDPTPRLLTLGEHVAGLVPLGSRDASGSIAGCLTAARAATKLGG